MLEAIAQDSVYRRNILLLRRPIVLLFVRWAEEIVMNGSLATVDLMRNVPLGFDNTIESKLLPYLIVWTYKILRLVGVDANIEYAGVVFPVIMFALTILTFFLFRI